MRFFDLSEDATLVSAVTVTARSPVQDNMGRRVQLRPKPGAVDTIYGTSGILQPLRTTNGLVWPYQPTITWDQGLTYGQQDLVHSNQEFLTYTRSNAAKFTVAGKFTCQSQTQGLYALAAIHFVRTVTKMNFGDSDPNAGTPPPVLIFNAYGNMMFNNLPVVVTAFTVGLPDDVDYVPIDVTAYSQSNNSQVSVTPALNFDPNTSYDNLTSPSSLNLDSNKKYVWLPAVFDISISLTVQNTPSKLRSFNLDSFRTGKSLKAGGWT